MSSGRRGSRPDRTASRSTTFVVAREDVELPLEVVEPGGHAEPIGERTGRIGDVVIEDDPQAVAAEERRQRVASGDDR